MDQAKIKARKEFHTGTSTTEEARRAVVLSRRIVGGLLADKRSDARGMVLEISEVIGTMGLHRAGS